MAHPLPAGWPAAASPMASGLSPVTARYSFTVPTGSAGQSFTLKFGAWTAGVVELVLTFILHVVALELPEIEVTPTTLDFEERDVNTKTELAFTIRNVGNAYLRVSNLAIERGAPFSFFLGYLNEFSKAPGGSETFLVSFLPTEPGTFEDVLTVSSDDPTNPTVTIQLKGSAVLPKLPKIKWSPDSFDFGEVRVNHESMPRELTIENIGDADLWVGVSIEGGTKSPFTVNNVDWIELTLPPGEDFPFTVCYSPETAALHKDAILIDSNDLTMSSVTIPVQGYAQKEVPSISCRAAGMPTTPAFELPPPQDPLKDREVEVKFSATISTEPPRRANYTVQVTDPGGKTWGPYSRETGDDGKDEGRLLLLPEQFVTGNWPCAVTWLGDEQYLGRSGLCEFKVTELGPYEGTEAGPSIQEKRESRHIDTTFNPVFTDGCEKIRFIQVITRTAIFSEGGSKSLKPSDLTSDPEWVKKDKWTVEVDGRFYTLDRLCGATEPYYHGTSQKLAVGCHDGTTKAATMRDGPRYSKALFDRIEAAEGRTVKKIVLEFEAFAFCVDGVDKGKFYEGMKWTHQGTEKQGTGPNAAYGDSTRGWYVSKPSKAFEEALKAWCDNHPSFKLPTAK